MRDLFKSELLRFRGWMAAIAGLHLIVLGFMTRVVDLAQQPLLVHWVIGGIYALLGLLLGLYQMGGYGKPSHWLNLLHRPLSRQRIATALFGAGVVSLLVAVALPVLVIAIWQETMTARVADLRHWMLPLSALLIASCGYLTGGFCRLRGMRQAGAAIVLLCWLIASRAYGFGFLAVELIAFAWLVSMLFAAFQPDLSSPPRGAVATLVTAVPLAMSMYLLVLVVLFGIEMLWIAQGSHPNNTATPPVGGHNEVERMDERGRMLAALGGSTHPDAPLLREQIALSEPHGIGVQVPTLPQKNELANFRPMEFEDAKRRVRWVFSHDDMRLHGYSLVDNRRDAGTLGVGEDNAAFPAVVLPSGGLPGMAEGDAVLIGGNTLYQYVSEEQRIHPRIRVAQGETLLGGSPVGESLGMLSDRALYFYDSRALVENTLPIAPRLRVALPGMTGDLRNLELIELVDGYLIDFTFSEQAHNLHGVSPYQIMLRTHDDGRVETINRRELRFDYPAVYRYRSWWPSPALYALREAALDLFAPPLPLDVTDPAPIPRNMWLLAGVLGLLSLLGSVWRSARTALSKPARGVWIVACGLFGLPALASLWLMVPLRERLDDLALAQPAHA